MTESPHPRPNVRTSMPPEALSSVRRDSSAAAAPLVDMTANADACTGGSCLLGRHMKDACGRGVGGVEVWG
eukprot:121241-Chlamydomonas_euryale.AAC.1